MRSNKNLSFTKKLTESAVMLALSVVLSYLKLIDLPYGGSITLCSMLPTLLIAYRHGVGFGLLTGLANGLLQLLMGMNNLSYATSAMAAAAIIMLDYILAFSVTGFGGMFKKTFKSQKTALSAGVGFVCFLRYIFHVISGCTVWAGLSIPTNQAFIYSVVYNATYMLPELIIAVAGAFYLGNVIDFSGDNLKVVQSQKASGQSKIFKIIGGGGGLLAFIADIVLIAPKLQNAETGEFDITGIFAVNFTAVLIVTVIGIVWSLLFYILSKKRLTK